ncbi:MAG: hypothetical protein P8X47_04920 [Ignavibacteriaceae bacterium]
METFIKPKALVENPNFQNQRREYLSLLKDETIDRPITGLINSFNDLRYCFTLQCCYGHFVYEGQPNPKNVERLPLTNTIPTVEYRIAYIAFCIENSDLGRKLLEALKEITNIDPDNIQFGCAEWFWERNVNSYVLQVEPDRFKLEDKAILVYNEALEIEEIRDKFFIELKKVI